MLSGKKMSASKILPLLLLLPYLASAQQPEPDSMSVDKKRLKLLIAGTAVTYSGALVGLNQLWYSNAETQSFQFFNDNPEWKQMDKLGHFHSSFYISYAAGRMLRWANVDDEKADLAGALTGFAVLLPIEVLDGFSDAYGASVGDLFANAAGASAYLLQKRLWKEIRIYPKFSFHQTDLAPKRPDVLGRGLPSEILKDYNGQTYWLSADMDKFMKFPKWLNIALGYGADEMIYARTDQHRKAGLALPYRQFYLSLDLDLTSINTRSKALKTLIFFVNMVRIPAPTLEFSRQRMKFHPFYF
jgi:uncharacterized protein YfiM (DUF2279 family)